jgi:hypothetical protein
LVDVNILPVEGLMRILISAEVCQAADISIQAALDLAEKILVGGIFTYKGMLALRLVLTEGHYSMPLVQNTIMLLQANAIWLRGELMKANPSAASQPNADRF